MSFVFTKKFEISFLESNENEIVKLKYIISDGGGSPDQIPNRIDQLIKSHEEIKSSLVKKYRRKLIDGANIDLGYVDTLPLNLEYRTELLNRLYHFINSYRMNIERYYAVKKGDLLSHYHNDFKITTVVNEINALLSEDLYDDEKLIEKVDYAESLLNDKREYLKQAYNNV